MKVFSCVWVRELIPPPADVGEGTGSVGCSPGELSSGRPSAGVLSGKGCWGSCFAFPTEGVAAPGSPLAAVWHTE